MGAISSASTGIANLMQTLTNVGSSLVSTPSATANLQSALQNASTSDIVQLSDAALKLQATDEMFGVTPSSSSDNLLSALETSAAAGSSASTELSAAESQLQQDQNAALLGNAPSLSSPSNLVNLLA
jgi:hypothetical protein